MTFLRSIISATILLAIGSHAAAPSTSAGCPTGYGFSYPNSTDPDQQNLQFQLGQKIQVQWRSPWESVKLAFIGEDSDTFIFIDQGETRTTFNWNVNVNNSKNDNNQYYLYIENQNDNTQHCFSSLWSISDDAVVPNGASQSIAAPTTTQAAVHTPTPTEQINIVTTAGPSGLATVYVTQAISSVASVASAGSAGAASTGPASPNASPVSNGLSDGAKAGIGVGVTLGILLLAGAAAGAFFLGKRQRRAQEDALAARGGPPGMGGDPMAMRGGMPATSPMASTIPSYYQSSMKDPSSPFVSAVPVPYGQPQELDPATIKRMPSAATGGRQLHEMSATNEPTSHQVYELDGGR